MYNKILHAIPKSWNNEIVENLENINDLVVYKHHLIKKPYRLNKLNCKEICNILIASNDLKTSSQRNHHTFFQNPNLG